MSIPRPFDAVLDRLLPQRCLLCAAEDADAPVCRACAADLPPLDARHCPRCALPTPGGSTCGACLRHAPRFDATHAVFAYAYPVDRLIQALKYSRRLASADFLASALAALAQLATASGGRVPDSVIPVPLSRRRLAERGFNQALELARPLAARAGAPLETRALERVLDTPPLATLPFAERRRNIRHAFECRADLSGLRIWVVDDVMTTGATLNEVATILKRHGAASVENFVVARTVRD